MKGSLRHTTWTFAAGLWLGAILAGCGSEPSEDRDAAGAGDGGAREDAAGDATTGADGDADTDADTDGDADADADTDADSDGDTDADGGADADAGMDAAFVEKHYTYQVIHEYPHDQTAFTEGLLWEDGGLYEGTGIQGQSDIRRVALETGAVLRQKKLPVQYFGEGITTWGGKLVELTWRSQVGFVYDKATFTETGTFNYATEGWGLTHDGQKLIMSDGTAHLYFLDPDTYAAIGSVPVSAQSGPVDQLNELELINGVIFANVWETNNVVQIDPATGRVLGWIDLSGLLTSADCPQPIDVLNGIAWDADGKRLFVTGKWWCKLFEIELVEQ